MTLNLLTTDYFTFLVIKNLYKNLKQKELLPKLDTEDVISSANSFLLFSCSFGIGCLLIFRNEPGIPEIVLCKRTSNLFFDSGKWHLSMNETFIPDDVQAFNIRIPSLISCLSRGLHEELGIPIHKTYDCLSNGYGFFNLALGGEHCLLGLASYLIVAKNNFTYNDLETYILDAKDKNYEIADLKLLSFNNIPNFLTEEKGNMSLALHSTLRKLYVKYKSGLLGDQLKHNNI